MVLYSVNIAFSFMISLIIINKLYIKKKFSKEQHFHFYNDLFSWEMFFFMMGISSMIAVLSIVYSFNISISLILLKVRFFILLFAYWNKIIHLEEVMEKITYERHYFGGIIPMILGIMLFFIEMPIYLFSFIILCCSFIPYLFLLFIFKRSHVIKKKFLFILAGVLLFAVGSILEKEILIFLFDDSNLFSFFNLLAPILFIIGTFSIFESFRKEI
ncbi:MAG: hypothetical protein JXA99_17430 [Candidatus Lokiarchaeota archaeon]|nr:hypothetical protein [Candidatus Lokiarchaeota archaeon]